MVPHGPGLWKLNVSVLDDEYVEPITDFWSLWRSRMNCFPSLAQWWDAGKSKIKGLTVSFVLIVPGQRILSVICLPVLPAI